MRFETWCVSDHPVCAFQRWLRSILLMAQPPLLFKEGNIWIHQEERYEAFASSTCSGADAGTAVRGAATAGVLRNTHSSTSRPAMLQLPYRREDGRAAAGLQRKC